MQHGNRHEYVIIGAGPAALQMAYFLERAGRSYVALEANPRAGSFFETYPRHRKLLSINKRFTGRTDPEFNLRHDWNSLLSEREDLRMTEFSEEYFPPADRLVEYLNAFAKEWSLNVAYGKRVLCVERPRVEDDFVVHTTNGDYRARCVLVATGLSLPNIPKIPGIELTEGYETVSVNPKDFENQSVLILGKGNSAFETADNLISRASLIHVLSPTPLRLAWESRFVGHLRAVNNNLLDTYHLKSQNAVIDGNVHQITRTPAGKLRVKFASIHASSETEQLDYDRVIRCTGFRFDASIFSEECRPGLTDCGRLPLMTPGFEARSVPGLFFLGAPTQSLDYKRAQSAFIHGFRYNVRTLFHLLEQRYAGLALPHETCTPEPGEIARMILVRMNAVSSLWQQVGFLADLLVVPDQPGEAARYFYDLPYEYLKERGRDLAGQSRYYICMFKLGMCPGNPFDHPRSANPDEGDSSTAIHPTFEVYDDGQLEQSHHVLEDFLGDWSGVEYLESATRFFEYSLKKQEMPKKRLSDVREIVRGADMRLVNQAPGQRGAM